MGTLNDWEQKDFLQEARQNPKLSKVLSFPLVPSKMPAKNRTFTVNVLNAVELYT